MTITNDTNFEIRSKNRIESDSLYSGKEIIDFAQSLLSDNIESESFQTKFSDFATIFDNMQIKYICTLKSMNFDQFLIKLLENSTNQILLQQCLECINKWISNTENENTIFLTPDFTNFISNLIASTATDNTPICRLGYSILKNQFIQSDQTIDTLLESDFIKNSIEFYQNLKKNKIDDQLQKEILDILYLFVKSNKIPYEIMINMLDIITNIQFHPLDHNLSDILLLASAYAECDQNYCFFLIERTPLESFYMNFDTLSDHEQAAFFRLLISIFDFADKPCLTVISDQFRWDLIMNFDQTQENEIVKQYFAKFLCSAFAKSNQMIIGAFEAGVFQLLLDWGENESYAVRSASIKAMLRTFSDIMEPIGLELLNIGILNMILKQIECNSKSLFREVCIAIYVLNNYAETNNKKEICEILSETCFMDILKNSEENEEVSSEDIEILKEAIQTIQDNKLWS